jgi:hypothetical protein
MALNADGAGRFVVEWGKIWTEHRLGRLRCRRRRHHLAIYFQSTRHAQLILFLPTLHYHVPLQRTGARRPQGTLTDLDIRLVFHKPENNRTPLDRQTTFPTRQTTPRKPGYTNALGMCSMILHSAASMNAECAAIGTTVTELTSFM